MPEKMHVISTECLEKAECGMLCRTAELHFCGVYSGGWQEETHSAQLECAH